MKNLLILCAVILVVLLSVVSVAGCKAESELTPPPPTMESLTYTNSEYGFLVEYPKDWDVYEDIMGATVLFAGPLVVDNTCYLYISSVVDELPHHNMALKDFVNVYALELKRNLRDYRQEREYNTTINGMPATVLVFTHTSDYAGEDVTFKEKNAVLVNEKLYYLINYFVPAEFHEDYVDCFELAISSFRFE